MDIMKRLIILTLLISVLLCGCVIIYTPSSQTETQPQATLESTDKSQTPPQASTDPTQPSTEAPTESTGTAQAQTEETTAPTLPEEELVTVYLLTRSVIFDSGSTEYTYDDNYNIVSYIALSLEDTPMYEVFFENRDANGMAGVVRSQWPGGIDNEIRNLTYFEDGKLKEEQIVGFNFTGYQYAYDHNGNRTEKREYFDGILQSVVYYEYDGEVLKAAYCEDTAGNIVFECRIENGLILEKNYFDPAGTYGYLYEYDENDVLVKTTFYYDGEYIPGDQYFYAAVEVDAERAHYLQEQQNHLIFIT